ncbi:MAG: hypothetical protein QXI91_01755 [Candidatus Bathyarchaeia archaeon]
MTTTRKAPLKFQLASASLGFRFAKIVRLIDQKETIHTMFMKGPKITQKMLKTHIRLLATLDASKQKRLFQTKPTTLPTKSINTFRISELFNGKIKDIKRKLKSASVIAVSM